MSNIAIIGAGIIGLTCAEELLRHGHDLTIFYDTPLNATTSSKAGAIWYPYKVEADEKALGWAMDTLDVLNKKLSHKEAGCFQTTLHQYFDDEPVVEKWMDGFDGFQLHGLNDDKAEFDKKDFPYATQMKVPLVDSPLVMKNMVNHLSANDVKFHYARLSDIETDARLEPFDLIINCSGMGAKELAHDDTLQSGRGQVLLMTNPNLNHSSVYAKSDDELTYILPRGDRCVVGGCYQIENDNINEDKNLTQLILERAYRFAPALKTQAILDIKVGFRPVRPTIRLEKQIMSNRTVIHNYGHGGAGWSFAWGCALEVSREVSREVNREAADLV